MDSAGAKPWKAPSLSLLSDGYPPEEELSSAPLCKGSLLTEWSLSPIRGKLPSLPLWSDVCPLDDEAFRDVSPWKPPGLSIKTLSPVTDEKHSLVISEAKYRKIPKISLSLCLLCLCSYVFICISLYFSKALFEELIFGGLIFGGAYLRRENCVSKSIGLAL